MKKMTKAVVEGQIMLILICLIFAVAILYFAWGFIQKGINLMAEGVRVMLLGLFKWFCAQIPGSSWVIPFCRST